MMARPSTQVAKQRIFVVLSPFGLQPLYAGVLYAFELKEAIELKLLLGDL